MRTLVVHTGGLGDFLLACPAIQLLAQQSPVELLGRSERLELAVAAGIACAAHDIERTEFESVFTQPSRRLRGLLDRFDRCIVWMRDDGVLHRSLVLGGIADVRTFPGLPPVDWHDHASRYYLDCLGVKNAPPLRLAIAPSTNSRDVIIHPGSGSSRKNWPVEHFEAATDWLLESGRSVAWVLGPADDAIRVPPNVSELRPESPVALARELAAARLYIGNDSGVTHLAGAVGCPTVAIFGPTDPRIWAPLGNHVEVISRFPWPDVETVQAAIQRAAT